MLRSPDYDDARLSVMLERAKQRSQVLGQRRRLGRWISGTVTLVAAAGLAGALAVLPPNQPQTRGTDVRIETIALVTRVENALSEPGQRNVVGYARTVYPPGYGAELAAGGLRVFRNDRASSPWDVGYLVRWSYQGTSKISAFTAAGRRIIDLGIAPVDGTLTSTGVSYRSETWWRGPIGAASAGDGPALTQCGPGVKLGAGGWPAFIRHELSCGEYTKGGRQRIGGIEAIKLTGTGELDVLWVNPRTYLPVRAIFTRGGVRFPTGFGWLAPAQARLGQLHVPVPPGFRQVSPP